MSALRDSTGTPHVAQRIRAMAPSPTMAMAAKAAAIEQQGHKVLNLTLGEPDFGTPEHLNEAARRAIRDGKTKYTPASGIPELRDAICEKFHRENRIDYQPAEVIVAVGAKQVLYNLCMAICDPGDEVIVPVPVWQTFVEQVRLAEGNPVLVKLGKDHRVTRVDIEPHITARTRAIFLNSPNNPTGVVMDPLEVRAIAELAVERGIYLIGDETYEHFLYGDASHVMPAALDPEVKRWTIEVSTVSKTYAMTGWRVGYAAGPAEIIGAMAALMGQSTTQTASVSQWAAVEALTGSQDCVQAMVGEFAKRREFLITGLKGLGIQCAWPEGAFYAYPEIPTGEPSVEFADRLLTDAHIASVPGADFYGEGHLRLSYATSLDVLTESLQRIEQFLNKT